jgi:hypothetical protein
MGSSLFKLSKTFSSFFQIFNNSSEISQQNKSDEEFRNYLENYSQGIRQNQKLRKSNFANNRNMNEKYEIDLEKDQEAVEEISYTDFTNSKIPSKPKNLKKYLNEISEKDFLYQKLMNKSINREMRKIRRGVNNISTTDTVY